ncbi:hypothetical protein DES53_107195 [Roseimicrobium gellanilyticum]|uniref:Uncharacterized protein n=1 Tax=Roseimicrobium gellanilyticum TaxID=748857 RepID=A0A366HFL5_9BACT|nr:hypothetical protein DES53_107195 [Roseimicrobium gellanilyticum]
MSKSPFPSTGCGTRMQAWSVAKEYANRGALRRTGDESAIESHELKTEKQRQARIICQMSPPLPVPLI